MTIKPSEYEKALSPDVWPYRVGVRHFKQKRKKPDHLQNQFSQSGGHIALQPRHSKPALRVHVPAPVTPLETANRFEILSDYCSN